ncbi:MAG: glycosyltransferase family 39 protein [Candidatus Eremiobacteraeota bacterium]|nr:glycosyltransferase family 39 protein [Candidatus Eremiobacteraeota bacterium]
MWAVLLGIPALCMVLLLDRRSMWLDEVTSMMIAHRDAAGIMHILQRVDAVFALYYGLLHAWLAVADGTASARALSALFALATLPAAYALGNRLLGRRAAFIGTFLLGTSYTFLRYAVEARPYALEILLCTLSGWCFVALLDAPRARRFVPYVATTLLAIYAHPLAILWVAAHAVGFAFVRRTRALVRGFAVSVAAIAAGLLPLVAGVRRNGTHQIDWIPPITPERAWRSLESLAGGSRGGPLGHDELAAVFAGCVLAGCVLLLRERPPREARLLVVWLVVPIFAILVASMWKPVEPTRYYAYVIVPAALIAGAALAALRRTAGVMAAACAVAALAIGGAAQMALYRGEDWRAAAAIVDGGLPADGVIVCSANVLRALRYAERERGHPEPVGHLLYPPDVEWTGDRNKPPVPSDLPEQAARMHQRLWIVLSHDTKTCQSSVLASMARRYGDVAVRRLDETIEIHELRRRQVAAF